jgi:hypothetical protein
MSKFVKYSNGPVTWASSGPYTGRSGSRYRRDGCGWGCPLTIAMWIAIAFIILAIVQKVIGG